MVLRRGRGEVVRRAPNPLVTPDGGFAMERTPLLAGIDVNGNTIFNARQMLQLLEELKRLGEERLLTAAEEAWIADCHALCNEGQRPPHRFLWFVGD